MNIAEKVKEILKEQLDVAADDIKESSRFVEDLHADSLAMVEVVLAMEEAFDTAIADEEAQSIRTVGDAISFIERRRAEAEGAREAS
jgi:acyl carrier protein